MTTTATPSLFTEPTVAAETVRLWFRETRRHHWRLVSTGTLDFDERRGHWLVTWGDAEPDAQKQP